MSELIGHQRFRKVALTTGRTLNRLQFRGLPRLMYWTRSLISPAGVNTIETVSGLNLALDLSDYASCMMFYGVFSSELIQLLSLLVAAGDSVIDVGAQVGYISSHLARLVGPTGRVHSFEPDPNALARLRASTAANGQDWIRIFPVAAGRGASEIDFYVSPTIGWSTALEETHLTNLSRIKVRCAAIDELAAAGEIQRPVSFVKIDVEGYECAVLEGMQQLLSEDQPFVLSEVNPELLHANKQTTADLLGWLKRLGYRSYRVDAERSLFGRGRFALAMLDESVELGFCDVLCVAKSQKLPPDWRIR
jgi:FkbM family methyltransferase